jgi:hypothetical protein
MKNFYAFSAFIPGLRLCVLPGLVLGSLALDLWAQDSGENRFSLGRMQDIAARPMALGSSYTAVASDASALFYNAAGLSSIKKHEWSATLERSALFGLDRAEGFSLHKPELVDMRIQSLAYVLPIPATRGGLTFAFGYYRPRTFADLIVYDDSLSASRGKYNYAAEGSLEQYRAGFGLDIAPNLTFGLATSYLSGQENIRVEDDGTAGYLRSYRGLNLEPSLMVEFTPRMKVGLSLVVWEKIFNLQEVYEVKGQGNDELNYVVDHPFQAKLGWAYQGNDFLLAADCKLNGWSQYRYGLEGMTALDKTGYKDEVILSLGAEKFITSLNMVLRAGYTWNTLPETNFNSTYDLNRFSAGVGLLASGSLSLDAAYSYAFWGMQGSGLTLDNREHRTLLTFAYRY